MHFKNFYLKNTLNLSFKMHFYISSIVNEAIKTNSIFLRRDSEYEKNTKTQNKRFFPSYNVFVDGKIVAFVV